MHAVDEFEPPLDPGIKAMVRALRDSGVETFESCDGSPGHAYREPTVRFHGDRSEGFRALAAALGKPGPQVMGLRARGRWWRESPTGPWWELVFLIEPAVSG